MTNLNKNIEETSSNELFDYDYSFVKNEAIIAIYDDFLSDPRIIKVPPNNTRDFIGELSSKIYEYSSLKGGKFSFSVIRQLTENLIHSQFCEIVVSILDNGNCIKFSDQGPGIKDKNKALLPGFSSATKEMKKYIDGVGSGLPIALEYLNAINGKLVIEDNLNHGTVVTLTLNNHSNKLNSSNQKLNIDISQRGYSILSIMKNEDLYGVKDLSEILSIPQSSIHNELNKLQSLKLIKKVGTKRVISQEGLLFINNS